MRQIDDKRMEMEITLESGKEVSEWRRALPPAGSGYGGVYCWTGERTLNFFPVELEPGQIPPSALVYRPTMLEMIEAFEKLGTDYLHDLAKRCKIDVTNCNSPREMVMRIFMSWARCEGTAQAMAEAKAASQQSRAYWKENGPRFQQAQIDRENEEMAEARKAGIGPGLPRKQ
jgi:hypothetical protein